MQSTELVSSTAWSLAGQSLGKDTPLPAPPPPVLLQSEPLEAMTVVMWGYGHSSL